MRLVCPNCGAQYEVPDDVIPESGRDVQCSNCGDTWFQKHPSQDRELAEELEQPLDEAHWEAEAEPEQASEPEPELEPESDLEPEPEAEFEPEPELEPETAAWDEPEPEQVEPTTEWKGFDEVAPDEEPEAEPVVDAQPRELDPEVREVLREEAEQEMQARAAETEGLETQPDLGLEDPGDEASRREREARLRMARMRGLSDEEALGEEDDLAEHASRRDLLPDIDEINSTLRKDSDRAAAAEAEMSGAVAPAVAKTRGFSRGFRTIVLLAVLAILVYVFADQIAGWLPAAEGALNGYVAAVDTARLWLDSQVLKLTGYLDGMTSE